MNRYSGAQKNPPKGYCGVYKVKAQKIKRKFKINKAKQLKEKTELQKFF